MAQRDISNVGVLLTHCDRFSIYCATHVAVMSVRFPPACHSVYLSLDAESRRVVRPIDASCMSLASISFRLIRVQIARCRLDTRRTAGHHRPNVLWARFRQQDQGYRHTVNATRGIRYDTIRDAILTCTQKLT